MISSAETSHYIQQSIPEMSDSLPAEGGIYATLNAVCEYACQKTREHNYGSLQQCFTVAASLYEKGSMSVKSAVENVFVYSMSRIFTLAPQDKRRIKALIPPTLLSLYMRQVLHYGY